MSHQSEYRDSDRPPEYRPDHCPGPSDSIANHPCFSASAHNRCGRTHIPCCPMCNIQCRFCRRDFNRTEVRPGGSRQLIAPEKAVALVRRALVVCPEITVVGIAGPGDTLATDHALQTFAAIHQVWPGLISGFTITAISLIGYSAMAGIVGGGGVGDLAIRFGYYRYQTDVMIVTVLALIILVQLVQAGGDYFACFFDRH